MLKIEGNLFRKIFKIIADKIPPIIADKPSIQSLINVSDNQFDVSIETTIPREDKEPVKKSDKYFITINLFANIYKSKRKSKLFEVII